jgi:hypothetical protein
MSHGAELICGARNMPFSVKSIELSNWILDDGPALVAK